jgi:hypothetical protein
LNRIYFDESIYNCPSTFKRFYDLIDIGRRRKPVAMLGGTLSVEFEAISPGKYAFVSF